MFRASIARRNVGRFRHAGAISQTFITPSRVLSSKYVLLHPRCYSTPVSSPHVTQIQSEKAQLHPSVAPEHRKPTVDLRPGPRKTSSSTPPPVHTAPTPTVTPIQPQPPSILPAPPRPPKSEEGILKSALNDVDEAIRIGQLPPIPDGATGLKLNWHKLKSMFMFYMRGIKYLVVEHRQHSSLVQRLAKEEKREMSWRERRFVETYRTDLVRLVPFVLVFAVIEELIPVIILYAPGFLPSTCKLQPQQDRIDNLADDRRYEALSDAQTLLKKLPTVVESSEMSVHELPSELVPLMCKVLSISNYGLEWLGRMRLQQRLTQLTSDDALLSRQQDLTDREIKSALAERGFATRTLTTPHLRPRLDWWLDNAQGGAMSARLRLLLKLAQGRGDVPS